MPAVKSSLVQPAYKTEYRVRNWRQYEQGLCSRGYVTTRFSDQVERFTADEAYDKMAVHDLVTARGADLVAPPTKNARLSRSGAAGARARNATVESVREFGRREWKKRRGYYQQARVENSFYRYRQLIGGRLRSRNAAAQETETGIAINVLNRMLELGAPRSEPIHN